MADGSNDPNQRSPEEIARDEAAAAANATAANAAENKPEEPGLLQQAGQTVTDAAKKVGDTVTSADLNNDGKPDAEQVGGFMSNNSLGLIGAIAALAIGMFSGMGIIGTLLIAALAFFAGSMFNENGVGRGVYDSLTGKKKEEAAHGEGLKISEEKSNNISADLGESVTVDGIEYNVTLKGQRATDNAAFHTLAVTKAGDDQVRVIPMSQTWELPIFNGVAAVDGQKQELIADIRKNIGAYNEQLEAAIEHYKDTGRVIDVGGQALGAKGEAKEQVAGIPR